MRGGDGVVTEIRKRRFLERVEGVMFVGGVCRVKRGDAVGVGDRVVSVWRRSCRLPMVRVPVPCEPGKAANIYFGIVILMTIGLVGEEVVIAVCDPWSRPL